MHWNLLSGCRINNNSLESDTFINITNCQQPLNVELWNYIPREILEYLTQFNAQARLFKIICYSSTGYSPGRSFYRTFCIPWPQMGGRCPPTSSHPSVASPTFAKVQVLLFLNHVDSKAKYSLLFGPHYFLRDKGICQFDKNCNCTIINMMTWIHLCDCRYGQHKYSCTAVAGWLDKPVTFCWILCYR